MLFAGIQKLTLLDYPQHVACTLFTQGCGYRCPFCHNSSLLPLGTPEQPMTEEAVPFESTLMKATRAPTYTAFAASLMLTLTFVRWTFLMTTPFSV